MISRSQRLFALVAAVSAVWIGSATNCSAHPDHPVQIVSSDSWLHYIVEPEHAVPLALIAAAAWLVRRATIGKLSRRVAS